MAATLSSRSNRVRCYVGSADAPGSPLRLRRCRPFLTLAAQKPGKDVNGGESRFVLRVRHAVAFLRSQDPKEKPSVGEDQRAGNRS
jgi:hypothetical protein